MIITVLNASVIISHLTSKSHTYETIELHTECSKCLKSGGGGGYLLGYTKVYKGRLCPEVQNLTL